jgi:hypothetical protein
MPRKRPVRARRPDYLTRRIEITGACAGLSLAVRSGGDAAAEFHDHGRIELTGSMDEPIGGARGVDLIVYPAEDAPAAAGQPPWIGLLEHVHPSIRIVVYIPGRDFERVWALAQTGSLREAQIVATRPRERSAYVVEVSFSTAPKV